jgi:membrane protein DedA with SNARE-associated domain
MPLSLLVAIVLGTLVSEDLTCLGVGLLVAAGQTSLPLGLAGCFLGIVLGDVGLWWVGRVAGRRLLRWPWLARRLPSDRLAQASAWLQRRGGPAVLAARFVPGARLPLYVAAGALGQRARVFLFWVVLGALLWVPALVLSVAWFGQALAEPLRRLLGYSGAGLAAGAALAYLGLRLGLRAGSRASRARLGAAFGRLGRWEFWPAWLFYLPLVPWYAWLSLRHRGLTVWTAANPGIPAGGVVGESKFAILEQLPSYAVVPSVLIAPGDNAERLRVLREAVAQRGWTFPLILKPDAAQRGAGVKRVGDWSDAERYVSAQPDAILGQPYHPGPYEVGIFYYRLPGAERGHIFSITDKVFPVLAGDGVSTVEELIWRHPRYRLQGDVFLRRHAADAGRVLGGGERLPLALAGNHCQGTLFLDGAHLRTPELERALDAIAESVRGFFIGRFDVRYTDPDAFGAGRDMAIVELNGVTSESTDIYDPRNSLWRAYRTLYRQWALLFRIGAANRRRGVQPVGALGLLRLVWRYYRHRRIDSLAD